MTGGREPQQAGLDRPERDGHVGRRPPRRAQRRYRRRCRSVRRPPPPTAGRQTARADRDQRRHVDAAPAASAPALPTPSRPSITTSAPAHGASAQHLGVAPPAAYDSNVEPLGAQIPNLDRRTAAMRDAVPELDVAAARGQPPASHDAVAAVVARPDQHHDPRSSSCLVAARRQLLLDHVGHGEARPLLEDALGRASLDRRRPRGRASPPPRRRRTAPAREPPVSLVRLLRRRRRICRLEHI